jgi:hypothetical protein
MFAVIFEVNPKPEQWDAYLGYAKSLRPELERIDGCSEHSPAADQEGYTTTCQRIPTAEGGVRHWSESSLSDRPRAFSR